MIGKPRDIRRDRNAALEGLPLYLLIMVIIAAVGIAVVLGWMGMIGGPKVIDSVGVDTTPGTVSLVHNDTTDAYARADVSVVVTVKDQDGNPLSGATVRLTSSDVTLRAWSEGDQDYTTSVVVADTNNQGVATFARLSMTATGIANVNVWSGDVDVRVTMTDYTGKDVFFTVYAEA